jgi:hypothetical protein
MNKTFAVLYLVMTSMMSLFVFIFMKTSVAAVLFAAVFLVNVFLFADIFHRKQ